MRVARRRSNLRPRAGKRVGGAVYIHRDAISLLEDEESERLQAAISIADPELDWNVARIGARDVSLSLYEPFEQSAFPQLLASVYIDLGTQAFKATSYRERPSRPILHRKELLLAPDDARAPKFAAITRLAEERGLFADTKSIGASAPWARKVEAAGLEIRGAVLVEKGEEARSVHRHRTALVRRTLSQPMALALRLGMIASTTSVFDYGCGQGDDVAILNANGFNAFGWDPHFATDGERRPAHIVNLGFVLNVIEEPAERVETLRAAWGFAQRALIVAVMNRASFGAASAWTPYRDGVVTSRGTFQRYFSQDELRALVEMTLNVRPVTLAPGIVAVFRDAELEQQVAFARRASAPLYFDRRLEAYDRPKREAPERERADVEARLGGLIDDIWRLCLQYGRTPAVSELTDEIAADLKDKGVAPARAVNVAMRRIGDGSELAAIRAARREDLLVHFALSLFPGAPKYASLARSIQLDVRAFFSSHTAMLGEARAMLFQLGRGDGVRVALERVLAGGLAARRGEKVRFLAETLPRLPAPIRLLIGCAEVLEPDLASADFYDVYFSGDRVRGLWCEDAQARAPLMRELADVELTKLRVRRRDRRGRVLYGRAALLPPDHPDKAAQLTFDEALVERGHVTASGDGPDAEAFLRLKLD